MMNSFSAFLLINDNVLITFYIVFLGLIIGSFLSVCIYRLPIGRFDAEDEDGEAIPSEKEKLSLIYPKRSFCPHCKNQLKWYHNIPLFSWIFLGGRCAFCKTKIPFRYPLIEILSAIVCFLSFKIYGITLDGFIIYVFSACLIVMSFIDIDYFILPNLITYPMTIIGIILISINSFFHILAEPFCQNLLESLYGIFGALFLYLVATIHAWIRKKEGLGFGDIKLLFVIGIFFGWKASFTTIFAGSLIALVCTIIIMILKRKSFSSYLPFGPYLSLATLCYLFYFFIFDTLNLNTIFR